MGMMDRDYYKDIFNKREAEEQKHTPKDAFNDIKYVGQNHTPVPTPNKRTKIPLSVWDLFFYAVFVFIAIRTFGNFISTHNPPLLPKVELGITLFCAVTVIIVIHREIKRWSMTPKRAKNQADRKGW